VTPTAKNLLLKIGETEDASVRLTKSNAKAADELKRLGLADFIAISTGGAWVALTNEGVEEYNKLF
jgi:hypothetical protein